MIQMNNSYIMRDGIKIGWISGDYIFNYMGKKVGYTTYDNFVYDEITGKKLAHFDGEFVYDSNTGQKTRLEDEIAEIETPSLTDIQRVAIKIFFGN